MPQHGSTTKIYVNQYDLTSYFDTKDAGYHAEAKDATCFNSDLARSYVVGLKHGTLSLDGLCSGAVDAVDDVLNDVFGTATIITCPYVASDGGLCDLMVPKTTEVKTKGSVTGLVRTSAQGIGGDAALGIMVDPGTTITADTNGTTFDNGAATSNGAIMHLHVFSGAGAGTCLVQIRHSTDNFVASDDALMEVAGVTTTPSATRVTATGTVRRYVRVLYDVTGTFSALMAVGFGRRP